MKWMNEKMKKAHVLYYFVGRRLLLRFFSLLSCCCLSFILHPKIFNLKVNELISSQTNNKNKQRRQKRFKTSERKSHRVKKSTNHLFVFSSLSFSRISLNWLFILSVIFFLLLFVTVPFHQIWNCLKIISERT